MAKLDSFIKENLECASCGCVMVPDATKCPNCNTDYSYNEKEKLNHSAELFPAELEQRKGTEIITVRYRLICQQHGKIDIRANVTVSAVKCPFC